MTGSENSNAASTCPEWRTISNHTNRLNVGLQLHKDERKTKRAWHVEEGFA